MRWVFFFVVLFIGAASAQAPLINGTKKVITVGDISADNISNLTVSAPQLTDVQKALIDNKALVVEVYTLRLQAAQSDFQSFVRSLAKDGWELDLQAKAYKPLEKQP